jgi:hypothetical protein
VSEWKIVFKTQKIGNGDLTHKLEVEGGYLYRNILLIAGRYNVTMTFVPFEIRESRIANTEKDLIRLEELIYSECKRLSTYISKCDQQRYESDNKLEDRIDQIETHLVL